MSKAKYTYKVLGDVYIFEDKNGSLSLTNAMENVLDENNIQPGSKIVYRDSLGFYDVVLYKKDKSIDFILLSNCSNEYEAISARNRYIE